MSGKITDSLGRSSGLVKAVTAAGVDTIWDLQKDGQPAVTNNTATKITTWTATVDTESAWDNTNNKIVIPSGKDGKYLVSATITQTQASGNNSQNDTYDLSIYKNGSRLQFGYTTDMSAVSGATIRMNLCVPLVLDNDDYLEFYIYHNEGAAKDLQAARTYGSAHRMTGTEV